MTDSRPRLLPSVIVSGILGPYIFILHSLRVSDLVRDGAPLLPICFALYFVTSWCMNHGRNSRAHLAVIALLFIATSVMLGIYFGGDGITILGATCILLSVTMAAMIKSSGPIAGPVSAPVDADRLRSSI